MYVLFLFRYIYIYIHSTVHILLISLFFSTAPKLKYKTIQQYTKIIYYKWFYDTKYFLHYIIIKWNDTVILQVFKT